MARTRALDYGVKEDTILKTAARLFSVEGVERTSMATIAAECGYSKALLYHYYDSKESLLFDIVSRHVELLIETVREAGGSGHKPAVIVEEEPEKRLGAMVSALLHAYGENEDQHRIQLAGLPSLSSERMNRITALERELVDEFANVLAIVLAQNGNRSGHPGELLKPVTMSLFGMLNWHYMWFRDQGPMSREQYAKLATDLILHGVQKI